MPVLFIPLERVRIVGHESGSFNGGPAGYQAAAGGPGLGRQPKGPFWSIDLGSFNQAMSTSKQDAAKYFEQHSIKALLEQIAADLAVNQPDDPRRYMYDMLGRKLGLETSAPLQASSKTSILRIYMECQTNTLVMSKEFQRSLPHSEFNSHILDAWGKEGLNFLRHEVDQLTGGNSDAHPVDTHPDTKPTKSTMSDERESSSKVQPFHHPNEAEPQQLDRFSNLTRAELEQELIRTSKLVDTLQIDRAHAMLSQVQNMQTGRHRSRTGSITPSLLPHAPPSRAPTLGPANPPDACALRLVIISDTADIESLPRFESLLRSQTEPGVTTLAVMAGNFLAPSPLSSLDNGKAMVDIMNHVSGAGPDALGFGLVVLGNREAFIPIEELNHRLTALHGALPSANLPGLETDPPLPRHRVVEIGPPGRRRRIGFLSLLTLDEALYESPQLPPFGGALRTAEPPLKAYEDARRRLVVEEGCDLIVPITHQVAASVCLSVFLSCLSISSPVCQSACRSVCLPVPLSV